MFVSQAPPGQVLLSAPTLHDYSDAAIDGSLGLPFPLCLLLTACRTGLLRGASSHGQIRTVVFLKLSEQGALVQAVPSVQRAIHLVGRDHVFIVVFRRNREVLDALDILSPSHVLEIDDGTMPKCIASAVRCVRRLRQLLDLATIDLEFFSRGTMLLPWAAGARVRVGFYSFGAGYSYRGDLLTHRVLFNPTRHVRETFDSLVQSLTVDASTLPALSVPVVSPEWSAARFRPTSSDVAAVSALIPDSFKDNTFRIALHPDRGGAISQREWDPLNYLRLCRESLSVLPDACITFVGLTASISLADELVASLQTERCVSVAGRTTVRLLLTLFTMSDFFIGTDSGTAHFASVTGVRSIVLFGPETPNRFAPTLNGTVNLWAGLPCSPCLDVSSGRHCFCSRNQCMDAIGVCDVMAAVLDAHRYNSRQLQNSRQ